MAFSLQAILQTSSAINIVVDNARAPSESVTEEYYKKQPSRHQLTTAPCALPLLSPRKTPGRKSRRHSRRGLSSPRRALKKAVSPDSRWQPDGLKLSSLDEGLLLQKAGAIRPSFPVRRGSVDKTCMPLSMPTRRASIEDQSNQSYTIDALLTELEALAKDFL